MSSLRPAESLTTFEELHDCQKCHGKIVMITVDHTGNTYCGYCGERVDYSKLFKGARHDNSVHNFLHTVLHTEGA